MLKPRGFVLLCAIALSVGACSSSSGPSAGGTADVTGSWSGAGSGWTLSLDLTQTGDSVSGSGTLTGVGSFSLTVEGKMQGATLRASLAIPSYDPISYAGTVSGNEMTGSLRGDGFMDLPIVISRAAEP